ncbi:MAG: glycine cleavage system aminomethyltransferase GcvT, partial [Gaiellaceae bacterium]
MQTLRQTPLYERHVAAGARMVPFAGWDMPVQYEGVVAEHRAVRNDCGVFDVSHMGEIEIEGPRAAELLQSLLSNDLDRIGDGQAQYTLLTNDAGGILDDLIVY